MKYLILSLLVAQAEDRLIDTRSQTETQYCTKVVPCYMGKYWSTCVRPGFQYRTNYIDTYEDTKTKVRREVIRYGYYGVCI